MSAQPTTTTTAPQPTVAQNEAVPPSIVAAGTGVPAAPLETAEPQQAATAPGAGGVVEQTSDQKISFKEQVNGYAKKFAGTVFRNEDEKEFGEKKLQGQA
ncbi:uncharacterized protein L201_006242 [Kwoniella dendrophila CBS 6074]|uniref:Uncharacterized protein n=1 Tax=Kwoniella dendrophila CBS 6074 TaxID=1295534 RepID=A0AAX4K2G2_9TREE